MNPLGPDGETFVHPLPPAAVLLDRQMDRSDDGRHSTHGGGDQEGAGRGDEKDA